MAITSPPRELQGIEKDLFTVYSLHLESIITLSVQIIIQVVIILSGQSKCSFTSIPEMFASCSGRIYEAWTSGRNRVFFPWLVCAKCIIWDGTIRLQLLLFDGMFHIVCLLFLGASYCMLPFHTCSTVPAVEYLWQESVFCRATTILMEYGDWWVWFMESFFLLRFLHVQLF